MSIVARLAAAVVELGRSRDRVLVGIDGPDAAGKTTLADSLAATLAGLDVPVVRASVDGFHRPREVRYRRGPLSGEGYYRDSFDHDALLRTCLQPFRDGDPCIRLSAYDHHGDEARPVNAAVADRSVLVVDGVFLLQPALRPFWTLPVHLRTSSEEILRRALERDTGLLGSREQVRQQYLTRYLPGQALYRAEVDPEAAADVLIDHERPGRPVVVRWAPRAPTTDVHQ